MTEKIDDAVRKQLGNWTGHAVAALFPEVLNALPDRFEMLGICAQLRRLFAQATSKQLMAELSGKQVKDTRALRHAAILIQTKLIDNGALLEGLHAGHGWQFLPDEVLERVIVAGDEEKG